MTATKPGKQRKPKTETAIPQKDLLRSAVNAGNTPKISADPKAAFPIVGIGASAGGLAAFEAFFSGLPKDRETGMAFESPLVL